MLQSLDHLVKRHGDDAEDHDGCDYHVELEDLRPINDQIPKTPAGGEEFPDNNAHEREADIDFHIAENRGNGSRKHHF